MSVRPKAISVIIPVYNTEKYLSECLDSVLKQSFTDFELICVNDCSSDHSLDILNAYAAKDQRITVIDLPERSGPAAARNAALKVAENDSLKSSLADKNAENDSLKVHFNAINSELSAIKASIAFKLGTLLAIPKKLQQLKSV